MGWTVEVNVILTYLLGIHIPFATRFLHLVVHDVHTRAAADETVPSLVETYILAQTRRYAGAFDFRLKEKHGRDWAMRYLLGSY